MLEVAVSRKHHCDTEFIARVYRKLVFDTSARLHDSGNTSLVSGFYTVVKREECVGGKHCAASIRQGMSYCLFCCSYSVDLSAADTQDSLVLCDYDSV